MIQNFWFWIDEHRTLFFASTFLMGLGWLASSVVEYQSRSWRIALGSSCAVLGFVFPFVLGVPCMQAYNRAFTERPALLIGFVIGLLSALAWGVTHPSRRGRLQALTGLSLAAIIALTAIPDGQPENGDVIDKLHSFLLMPSSRTLVFDALPNAMLYVPAGFFLYFLSRSAGRTLAAILAIAIPIELCQLFLVGRVSQLSDLVANVVGAMIGTLAAVALDHLASAGTSTVRQKDHNSILR